MLPHPVHDTGSSSSSPQERWHRIALVGMYCGFVFLAASVYGIVDGDDLAGVTMTLLPGVASLGLWRLACWRRDR